MLYKTAETSYEIYNYLPALVQIMIKTGMNVYSNSSMEMMRTGKRPKTISPKMQRCLDLYKPDKPNYKEIAQITGQNYESVKKMIYRGLAIKREQIS